MPKYRYYVEEHNGDPENSYEFESKWLPETPLSKSWMAEEAGEDYHSRHDGWESPWPLTFVILDADFNELGRFTVDREAVPQFHATAIKEE